MGGSRPGGSGRDRHLGGQAASEKEKPYDASHPGWRAHAQLAVTGGTAALGSLYAVPIRLRRHLAGLLANSASTLNPLSGTLLVVYPLFEALPPVYGFRSSGAARPGVPLRVSMALSLLTAIGLAN